jgi:hypothetical protein
MLLQSVKDEKVKRSRKQRKTRNKATAMVQMVTAGTHAASVLP